MHLGWSCGRNPSALPLDALDVRSNYRLHLCVTERRVSRAIWLLGSVSVAVGDVVVSREIVECRERCPAFRLDDSDLGIGTGELLDRLDRVPEGHGQELHLPALLAPQQIGSSVAR